MGFFDQYQDTAAAGEWIGAEEKKTLIDNGIPFTITDVRYEQESQFGERYVAEVVLDSDPESKTRLLSFAVSGVESRDRMLQQMISYFETEPDEQPRAILEKVGRSILLRPAE